MSFDGNVHSLADKPAPSSVVYTATIQNQGEERTFLIRCRERFKGQEIVSDSIDKNRDGRLVYTARVRSQGGI